MDKILAILSNPAVIGVVGMVIESALRMAPTQKPASLLYAASSIIHKAADAIAALAAFLDKVLPQKLAAPAAVTPIK